MKRINSLIITVVICMMLLAGCSCQHVWEPATCEQPKTCSLCGETEGDVLSHEWQDGNEVISISKYCKQCGKMFGHSKFDGVWQKHEDEKVLYNMRVYLDLENETFKMTQAGSDFEDTLMEGSIIRPTEYAKYGIADGDVGILIEDSNGAEIILTAHCQEYSSIIIWGLSGGVFSEPVQYDKYTEKSKSESGGAGGSSSNTVTIGEKNALRAAEEYLYVSAFSYIGLIEQLEYEGYTTSEATYGADNCGADWYEQAAKCARQYLKVSSFSKQGLIEQLEYEGFTYEQAVYGVEQAGY